MLIRARRHGSGENLSLWSVRGSCTERAAQLQGETQAAAARPVFGCAVQYHLFGHSLRNLLRLLWGIRKQDPGFKRVGKARFGAHQLL